MTATLAPALDVELLSRIEDRTARVGLIGLGYVGLPLVLLFSEQRFPVTGFDIDANKVRVLTEGGSYIYRIPASEIQTAKQPRRRSSRSLLTFVRDSWLSSKVRRTLGRQKKLWFLSSRRTTGMA